jgi:hypothetical protein
MSILRPAKLGPLRRRLRKPVADAFGLYTDSQWLAIEMREQIFFEGEQTYDSGWWQPNGLANEGQASMLNVYFLGTSNPSKYIGLLNMPSSQPSKTTTCSTMTESTTTGTNGYNRQQIITTDWSSPALDSGDEQIQASQKTFGQFTGNVVVSHVFGTTASTGTSGLFLFYVPTAYFTANSAARTFVNGESYLVTLRDKQI